MGCRESVRGRARLIRAGPTVAIGVALAAARVGGASAQDPSAGAVRLGLTYEPGYVPGLVVAPVVTTPGLEAISAAVAEILRTDLDYSDRFQIIAVPDSMRSEGRPNYALWNQLGAVWLVSSDVSGTAGAPILRVGLHDVVYGTLQNVQAFSLPEMTAEGFRMAVHRASDAVVSWATEGGRGIAATRIAFRRRAGDGTSSLYVVDSDGRNPRRISTGAPNVFSPVFSPDGSRIAYTVQDERGDFALLESNLITGSRRTLATGTLLMTPTYAPDGRLSHAQMGRAGTEIVLEGVGRITDTRGDALNPTFSPDGVWFAFEADPTNETQIYVQRISGSTPRRISVFLPRERTNAANPDWSPNGDRIAYAAVSGAGWQIYTVNPDGTDRRMLTSRGESESPSWAPDGRHLVFDGRDPRGSALWILDTVTGRSRILTSGQLDGLPDWSPPLPPGS